MREHVLVLCMVVLIIFFPLNKQRLEWFSVNYVAGEAISDYAEKLNIKHVLVILKELMEIL